MDDGILFRTGHARAMVWRDALPYEPAVTSERASRSFLVRGAASGRTLRAAIEAMRPMGMPAYGMIGGRFERSESERLVVSICCPDEETVFRSTLVERQDGSIRRGLPAEYHDAVLDRAGHFCRDHAAAPGALRITCAAHCVYGSSPIAFSGLMRSLLAIFHAPDEDRLAAIVQEPWGT